MIEEYSITIIKCLIAILFAIIEGNAIVYVFNNIPIRWLTDYNKEPCQELLNCDGQRVKSMPWKFVFTMLFIIVNTKLVLDGVQWAINSSIVIWLLVEIAIGDKKYKIIPDQWLILLCISALGYIPFNNYWYDGIIGGVIGFLLIFICQLIGKTLFKKNAFGGGDLKLFASLGLVIGGLGILFVFCLTIIITSITAILLLAKKKIKFEDSIALAPFTVVSTGIYLMFFSYLSEGLIL